MADAKIEFIDGVKYIDGIPVIAPAAEEAMGPTTTEDDVVPEDTGMMATASRVGGKVVNTAVDRISGLIGAVNPANWNEIAANLLRPGTSEDVLPGGSAAPNMGVRAINELLKRPAATQAVGGIGGGLVGTATMGPGVGTYVGAQIGAEGANQLGQLAGTQPDVPLREDMENLAAGGVVDAATAGIGKLAIGQGLKGIRDKSVRANRPGELGALVGTPKGTTPMHQVLAKRLERHEEVLARPDIDPLAGVDPADPRAFATVKQNILSRKETLRAKKAKILAEADSRNAQISLTPDDLDAEVRATNSAGYPVTEDAIAFAKSKLRDITEQTGEWKSGMRSRLVDDRIVGVSERTFKPSELAEEIRRKVIDEKKRLGLYDTSFQAKATVDRKDLAQMQTERQGLDLLEDMMNRKLNEGVGSTELPDVNAGISALIDFGEQIDRADVGALGAQTVPHGAGQPAKLADLRPGWFDRAVNTILPGGRNNRATSGRTQASMDAQQQMLGPAQDVLRMKRGDTSFLEQQGIRADNVSKLLGGDAAVAAMGASAIPQTTLRPEQVPELLGSKPQAPIQFQRDSNVVRQMPQEFAMTVQQAAFEMLLQKTGSPEVAASVAERMSREALKIAASPSEEERAEGMAAIARTLPQVFRAGEYPDEMDGTVVESSSKLQLEDNAKSKLASGAVDSITYAKQKQEAFKAGPSRIIIRKSGQLAPERPQHQPNRVMMQSRTPEY